MPMMMRVMPGPASPRGKAASLIFSRMPPMRAMARNQPNPPPRPKANACRKLYGLLSMKSEMPRMAQLTVMSGRKMPREL